MSNTKKLEGLRFGRLLVVKRNGVNNRGEAIWDCLCDCGNITNVKSRNLIINKTQSCGCIKSGPKRKEDDFVGQKFKKITIVTYSHQDKSRNSCYDYKCECGHIGKIRKRDIGKTTSCMYCGFKRRLKDYEDLGRWYFNSIESAAYSRGYCFEVDMRYLWELWVSQKGLCGYSGRLMVLKIDRRERYFQTASIDRIDSKKGYVEGNIHWVHRDINMIKGDTPHEEFIKICKDIAEWNK